MEQAAAAKTAAAGVAEARDATAGAAKPGMGATAAASAAAAGADAEAAADAALLEEKARRKRQRTADKKQQEITAAQARERVREAEKKAEQLSKSGSNWRKAAALRRASWFFWNPRFGRALVLLWLISGLYLAFGAAQSTHPAAATLPALAWLKIIVVALVLATILAKAPRLLQWAVRRDLGRIVPELEPLFQPPVPANGYMVSISGQQHGPFTSNDLQRMISNDQVNLMTMIWRQGMPDWQPAGLVPGATGFGPLSRTRLRRLAAVVAGEPKPPVFARYASELRKINTQITLVAVAEPAQFQVKLAALPTTSAISGVLAALLAFMVFGGPLYGSYLSGLHDVTTPAITEHAVSEPTRQRPNAGQPSRQTEPPETASVPQQPTEPAPPQTVPTPEPPTPVPQQPHEKPHVAKRPNVPHQPPFTEGVLIGPEPLHVAPDAQSMTVTAPAVVPLPIIGQQVGADGETWLTVGKSDGSRLFVERARVKPWEEWRRENGIHDWFRGFANDSTHVYVGNTQMVQLYGVIPAPGQPQTKPIASYLMRAKTKLECTPRTGELYVCMTDQNRDLADLVLLNGVALPATDSLETYRDTAAQARNKHNGYWNPVPNLRPPPGSATSVDVPPPVTTPR
jgi:GYF domain 2